MFFHTTAYRDVLNEVLDANPTYLIACDGKDIVGALPTFESEQTAIGNVYNSLPFFGSPGGFVTHDGLSNDESRTVASKLLEEFSKIASNDALSATLVTSQFDANNTDTGNSFYESILEYRFRDDRLAQVLSFDTDFEQTLKTKEAVPEKTPTSARDATTIGEWLFSQFERRTRRAVRKPYKEGLSWRHSDDFDRLYEMHKVGMEAKGGTVKPRKFFEAVRKHVPEEMYDLRYASLDGRDIAGLLLFYYGDTVEYHTPAYEFEYRDTQATSMLIFEAMRNAIANGYRYWNFGGTRKSQESLYRFKRGWGAEDHPYYYYVIDFGGIDKLLNQQTNDLLNWYKWFYTVPFDEVT